MELNAQEREPGESSRDLGYPHVNPQTTMPAQLALLRTRQEADTHLRLRTYCAWLYRVDD